MKIVEKIINLVISQIVSKLPDYRFYPTQEIIQKIKNTKPGTIFIINNNQHTAQQTYVEPDSTIMIMFNNNAISLKDNSIKYIQITKRPKGETWKPIKIKNFK